MFKGFALEKHEQDLEGILLEADDTCHYAVTIKCVRCSPARCLAPNPVQTRPASPSPSMPPSPSQTSLPPTQLTSPPAVRLSCWTRTATSAACCWRTRPTCSQVGHGGGCCAALGGGLLTCFSPPTPHHNHSVFDNSLQHAARSILDQHPRAREMVRLQSLHTARAVRNWSQPQPQPLSSCFPRPQTLKPHIHARVSNLPICPELTRTKIPQASDIGKFLCITGWRFNTPPVSDHTTRALSPHPCGRDGHSGEHGEDARVRARVCLRQVRHYLHGQGRL